jgi:prepilin-type N-terminal cleavage/methylation domain-containing protein
MDKRCFWRYKSKGFTLIEVITAVAISTMVFAISYTVINSGTKFFHQQSGKVFARNDVRLALNQITKDIEESKDVDNLSENFTFIQENNQAVSYYYDDMKKAVIRAVADDAAAEARETVFINSVTNSFSIEQSASNPNTFNIKIETLNLNKYWGSQEVENHNITATRRYSDLIYLPSPLRLNEDLLPDGKVGQLYNWPFTATGGIQPYAYTFTNLPAWLKVEDNIISGAPTSSGVFTFTVAVQDNSNPKQTDSSLFTLNIVPASSGNEGTPFIDFNGDKIVNGNDYYINLKVLTDAEITGYKYAQKKSYGFIYTGPGYLVIPKRPTLPNQYGLYLYAANGIIIQDTLQTQNNGHDITLVSNGPIIVDNVTISGRYITVDSLISISRNQTKFVYGKSFKLVVNGKGVSP